MAVTNDTITVRSPGGPLAPVTLQELQDFNAPMLSRNPELHYVFARMGMAEERGIGIRSLKKRAEELGLPLPRYRWEDPYLVLTVFRSAAAAVQSVAGATDSLNEDERKALQFVAGRESTTSPHTSVIFLLKGG